MKVYSPPPRAAALLTTTDKQGDAPAEREIHSYIIGFDLTNMQLLFAFGVHDF